MRLIQTIFVLALATPALAGGPRALFTENKGQWPEQVLYRVGIPGGALFVERSAFTYVLCTGGQAHAHHGDPHAVEDARAHAYKVHFNGGEAAASVGSLVQPHYENFFIGNDPAHWGSECGVFGEVTLKDVWPGIDLRIDGRNGIKYDFIVAAGSDPDQIRLRFEGQESLRLKNGALEVGLSNGTVMEEAPTTFQWQGDGPATPDASMKGWEEIASRYVLAGDVVAFHLARHGDGPVIIDPTLTFASYSGSTADNFGFTASYDAAGHLYGGGNVFAVGYPSTVGALDPTFNGGNCDIGISKWAADGSSLIWSTYLGGNSSDLPHSLVVNADEELFVMGATGSFNFPTTPGCYDDSFNGGPNIIAGAYQFEFGADIYVAHLNAAGTALIGSTYVGGTDTDGLNNGPLEYNYGDAFRGEIALDENGDPVVSTSTSSADAPILNAPQAAYGGGAHDAYFFRMNAGLTSLSWATFHGGNDDDSGYGVQFDSNGGIFTTGGTQSADLPMAGTPAIPGFAGSIDGYIARYAPDGSSLVAGTFVGTVNYDQCFFVQLDTQDDVYVVGQTRGVYPITPGKYNVPGSSQFIHKFGHDLATSIWSTRIGNGNGTEDISPSAFLVSDCGQIYFSGWGGSVNNFGQPNNSTTIGLPTTPGAFQTTTDGSDFYLMVLEPDAVALNYATFFGGAVSDEHVDGGTSRFDKNGTVYQAVCSGCGGNDDFPTTPGAWSNTNNSFNCNLGVFKFDLAQPVAEIGIAGPNEICFPSTVQFTNTSSGGNTYFWNFGDGSTGNTFEPAHEYAEAGVFTVSMIMTDVYGCSMADTAQIQVISSPGPVATADVPPVVCPGGSVQLQASGGDTYEWIPATGLSDPFVADPIATPNGPITYEVVVGTFCGTDTTTVQIIFEDPQGVGLPDIELCLGDGVPLNAASGTPVEWSPPQGLSDPFASSPTAAPLDTTTYYVTVITPEGCEVVDSMRVNVVFSPPDPALVDTSICAGASVQLIGPSAVTWAWTPHPTLNALDLQSPVASPTTATTYVVLASNVCGSTIDSAHVSLIIVDPLAWPDTTVCPDSPVLLHASGGVAYAWSPEGLLSDANTAMPTAIIQGPTTFTVTVTDDRGCVGATTLSLGTWPLPIVEAGPDMIVDWGTLIQLTATGMGDLEWGPPDGLDCTACPMPTARPEASTSYTVTLTDEHGCKAIDVLNVILNGTLYVPNTFSPNGDGINDTFGAWGTEIDTYKLYVFNRWGEQIYTTDKMGVFWDGTYNGVDSPIDTYVWRIDVSELAGARRTLYGHVNLVR